MINPIKKAAWACLAVFALGACALTEDVVPVNYAVQTPNQSIGADGKAFKIEVADNRGVYRGQIGAKVNGWGQEMAAIRSTVPVQEIVRNALADELKARHITVDDKQARRLEVSITAMHNNFKVGFASGTARGITALTVNVVSADGVSRYSGTVSEIYEETDIVLATGENAAKAVAGALAKAIKALFDKPEFVAALVEA